jgi:hypothetical protein
LTDAGFANINIEKIGAESDKEIKELDRIYKNEGVGNLWYEYFITAEKGKNGSDRLSDNETNSEKYYIETISSAELTSEVLKEVSDFYRWGFNNFNNKHYLVNPATQEFLSSQEVFQKKDDEFVDIETMDNFQDFPKDEAGNQFVFWHDPRRTYECLERKFEKDANITLLRDKNSNKILGMSSWFKRPFKEIFKEEFQYPFDYSTNAESLNKIHERSFSQSSQLIGETFSRSIDPDEAVVCWNSLVLSPEARNFKTFIPLLGRFMDSLSTEQSKLFLAEVRAEGTGYRVLKKRCNFCDVEGVVDGSILGITSIKDLLKGWEPFKKKVQE